MNQEQIKKSAAIIALSLIALSFIAGGIRLADAATSTPAASGSYLSPVNNTPQSYTLLEPLPCIEGNQKDADGNPIKTCDGEQLTTVDFKTYVQYAFNLLIALAAVAAVFMIVWGGFQYMSSDSYQQKSDGLKHLQNAIYGLLLILSSYLILRTIDPRLVQIPTTLVKPLDIKYNPDEISAFFQSLNKDASSLRGEFNKILEARNKLDALAEQKKLERQTLCAQLLQANPNSDPLGVMTADQRCDALINNQGSLDSISRATAMRIVQLKEEERQALVQSDAYTARGLMNVHIQQCYSVDRTGASSNVTESDCIGGVARVYQEYLPKLQARGAVKEVEQLTSYAEYARAISHINATVLKNMSSNPYARAVVDTYQNTVTIAGTVAGAALGGPVGAVGGFVATQFANLPITVTRQAINYSDAQTTISQIQYAVNTTKDKITDPAVKEQFINQSYAIIKALGGKGDGSDSAAQGQQISQQMSPTPDNRVLEGKFGEK